MLTLVTTLFANDLPGPRSVYLSQDIKFLHPVFYNDTITAKLEVLEININKHIFLKTICTNQDGNVILDGIED